MFYKIYLPLKFKLETLSSADDNQRENICTNIYITNILKFARTWVLHKYMKLFQNDVSNLSGNTHTWSKIYKELYHCIVNANKKRHIRFRLAKLSKYNNYGFISNLKTQN